MHENCFIEEGFDINFINSMYIGIIDAILNNEFEDKNSDEQIKRLNDYRKKYQEAIELKK